MQLELPKRIPPRRELDHHTELEPRAKPLVVAPLQDGPTGTRKTEEVMRELLNTKPSKAPYGALVLFEKEARWVSST